MAEPAAILRSDQAVLRRWRAGDLDALDRAISESLEHLTPWMPWAADHGRHRTAGFLGRSDEEWATGEAFAYAITSDDTVIGGCGLHRRIGAGGLEIGYWLHPGGPDAASPRRPWPPSSARASGCPASSGWRSTTTPPTPPAEPSPAASASWRSHAYRNRKARPLPAKWGSRSSGG